MCPDGVNAFIKSHRCATQGLERHGARNICHAGEAFSTIERECTYGTHSLRSIQQRQALFYFELHGCDLRTTQGHGTGQPFASEKSFTLPNCSKCEMSQGRQIAARSHGTLFRNDWCHTSLEHRNENID